MLLKHILIFLFLLFSDHFYAQFFFNENYSENNIYNKNVSSSDTDNIYNASNFKNNQIRYNIPVKFWIIINDSTNHKVGPAFLKELIQYLNYYYSINNTGIRFSLRPDYQYINNANIVNLRYYTQAPIQAMKHKSKACINVIIANTLIKKKFLSSRKKNFAGTYNPFSKTVIITRNISTSTLSHEIGHYLGLKHPHRGWKYKRFQEPVSRTKKMPFSNKKMCEKKGDGLCDTPAEPNLTKYTDNKCNYTGWNVTDKFGEVYKPNTHNIMSYTNNRECRNKFTKQQTELMLNTLSKNKYADYWRIDLKKNKAYLPDAFEPDNHKETATEIFFNTPQTHSFNKVYTAKKNTEISDHVDWLFFDLKTTKPQQINLKFSGIKYSFPKIRISVFREKKIILLKEISEESIIKEIKISKALAGKYYVKISQVVENETENFYTIMIGK